MTASATSSASAPPASASVRLSVSDWRTRRPRLAPSASRSERFGAACRTAREQEVRDVRASDQQNRASRCPAEVATSANSSVACAGPAAARRELDVAVGNAPAPFVGDGRSLTREEPVLQRRRQAGLACATETFGFSRPMRYSQCGRVRRSRCAQGPGGDRRRSGARSWADRVGAFHRGTPAAPRR